MKPSTPVITLLAGTALGVAVLVASMVQTPSAAPVNFYAGDVACQAPAPPSRSPASSAAAVVTLPPPSSSTPTASASPTVSSVPTTAPAVSGTVPADADYAAQV